jgi:hypothetical protein
MLAFAALFAPVVLLLVVYDLRWIVLAVRAGRLPPWGAFARLFAALCCHGGLIVLLMHAHDWPQPRLTYWLHMTLDPGLTFYALGLYDLLRRVAAREARVPGAAGS